MKPTAPHLLLYLLLFISGPLLGQVSPDHAVGRTPGELSVTSSGAATYLVPFALPPGIGEVVPSLALSYNSQGGDGIAGWGWNIAGLSTISRVGATLHHDGVVDPVDFDELDRLALDGQRLLLKDPDQPYGLGKKTYVTENYSNLKIVTDFKDGEKGGLWSRIHVYYPDGSQATYKAFNDLEWVIVQWQDAKGNPIHYNYEKEGGLMRIKSISYGARTESVHPNQIEFLYKERSQKQTSFIGGKQFIRSKILDSIHISQNSNTYRSYQLTHGKSSTGYDRLKQLQESNAKGSQKPPIIFTYKRETFSILTKEYNLSGTQWSNNSNTGADRSGSFEYDPEKHQLIPGDFDGNGTNDLIIKEGGRFKLVLNHSDNFEERITQSRYLKTGKYIDEFIPATFQTQDNRILGRMGFTSISEEIVENDIANNNHMLYDSHRGETTFTTHALQDNTTTLMEYQKTWVHDNINVPKDSCGSFLPRKIPKRYFSGDFTGDGIADILMINKLYHQDVYYDNCESQSSIQHSYNRIYLADMDRNLPEFFVKQMGSLYVRDNDQLRTADYDGDGILDLWHFTQTYKDGKKESVVLEVFSFKDKYQEKIAHIDLEDAEALWRHLLVADINGDGKTDFMRPNANKSSQWTYYLSTGGKTPGDYELIDGVKYVVKKNQYFAQKTISSAHYIPSADKIYQLQDINQDGFVDLIQNNVNIFSFEVKVFSNRMSEDGHRVFQEQKESHNTLFEENIHTRGSMLPLDLNHHSLQNSFGYLVKDKIYPIEFTMNHRREVLLHSINHQGLSQTIGYQTLNTHDQESIYQEDRSQVYPYTNINNAHSLMLATRVTATGGGQIAKQEYRYKGAVSHARGLGFLGFMGVMRSNTFGQGVARLWNVSLHDPQKRGAITHSWTTNKAGYQLPQSNYVQKTIYQYTTQELDNRVYLSKTDGITTHDGLNGFTTYQSFTYDHYQNPTQILTEMQGGKTLKTFEYEHHPEGTTDYYIGRLKKETQTDHWAGKSHSTTTLYQDYKDLQPQTVKIQGQGTNWLTETMDYDRYGNLLSKTLKAKGKAERKESYTYSSDGRYLMSNTDIAGLTTQFEYYDNGTLKSETDPHGKTTTYGYDPWQRMSQITDYLGNSDTVSHTWAVYDIVTTRKGADGSQSKTHTSVWGKTTHKGQLGLNQQWNWVETQYDVAGRVIKKSEPSANRYSILGGRKWTSIYYDSYGRENARVMASGKKIETTYKGNTVTVNDGYQETITELDARGKIARLTDTGGTVVYTYHPNGSLLHSQYDGHSVAVTYDGWGRKASLSDPAAGKFTYQHNDYGELEAETAPQGSTTYVYDDLGRLEKKTQKGSHTHLISDYTYDPTHKMLTQLKVKDRENHETLTYDYGYDDYQRPEIMSEENEHARFSQTLSYDSYGRVQTEERTAALLSGGSQNTNLSYGYATNGVQDRISKDGKTLWTLKAHNARGQATEILLGNGITKNNTYDVLGYLDSIEHGDALSMSFGYHKSKGVMTKRNRGSHNETFSHDERNRLTTISDGKQVYRQSYDTYGRIAQNSLVGDYHYPQANRYAVDSLVLNGPGAYYYKRHPQQRVEYNMDRKAVKVTEQGEGTAHFRYNHNHQRHHAFFESMEPVELEPEKEKKEVVPMEKEFPYQKRGFQKHYSTIFPAEITLNKETGTVTFVDFVGGDAYSAPIAVINDEEHYLHRDHLGSILAISNDTGTVIEERHFTAWGKVAWFKKNGTETDFKDSILPRGFTGHEHFEGIKLIHMNGRMYDPQLRKFLSPDNHIQDPYNTMSYDRYGYVWNNPLMASDPSGEFIVAALIGAAIGILTNGMANTMNGQGFFEGWAKAALIGGISGGISFGIGEAASAISSSLTASGVSGSTSALITGAFQAAAHGTMGGIMSELNGGSFGSGFLSGVAGSIVGSAGGNLFKNASKGLKGIGTTLTGGVAGGIGSRIAGGNFWDGFRNGAISAGLNHAVHSGYFGDNLAAAAITGRLRHLWGADALAISGNAAAGMGGGIKLEKGGLAVLRGKDAGKFIEYDDIGVGASTPSASATAGITKLYYSGNKNFNKNVFFGSRYETNVSFDIGISVGATSVYAPQPDGTFVIGFGITGGFGASATLLDINFNYGRTNISRPWKN